ncbi:MAG: hypothetical protein AAGD01_10535 [Acidobacteriota bacterium]
MSADAQRSEITVELPPSLLGSDISDTTEALAIGRCTLLHEIYPEWCNYWHVVAVFRRFDNTLVGSEIFLENDKESLSGTITGVYRQYHLDNGKIVERDLSNEGESPVGEDWGVVKPYSQEALTVFSWTDNNKDGALGDGDSLVFSDGTSAAIETSRIGVKVSDNTVKGG